MSTLSDYLEKNGRFPKVSLQINPIGQGRDPIEFVQFEDYSFQSSVLTPVDSFSFTLRNPELSGSLYDYVQDGDIAILKANDEIISTGIIDTVNISTDPNQGELVKISGRALIGQMEDQSAINDRDEPMWGNDVTPDTVVNNLIVSTRINFYRLQQVPTGAILFATEPGESKLSALQRYVEPLNCIVWMDPDGVLVIGRPDMGAVPSGTFNLDRDNRQANVLSMQVNYSSTQIPNIIIPVWAGQESVVVRVAPEQRLLNSAKGPSRLFKNEHRTPKSIVVSTPQGTDTQSLSDINQLAISGGSNFLQAYAKREIARANVHEVGVEIHIQGHYDENLDPITIDSCYLINYPRASLQSQKMYLHSVTYSLSKETGQRTTMLFCRLGCIVADASVVSVKPHSKKKQVIG